MAHSGDCWGSIHYYSHSWQDLVSYRCHSLKKEKKLPTFFFNFFQLSPCSIMKICWESLPITSTIMASRMPKVTEKQIIHLHRHHNHHYVCRVRVSVRVCVSTFLFMCVSGSVHLLVCLVIIDVWEIFPRGVINPLKTQIKS